jgi:hypothetical protein
MGNTLAYLAPLFAANKKVKTLPEYVNVMKLFTLSVVMMKNSLRQEFSA